MCCYLLTRSGTPSYQPSRRCEQISSILMARSAHHAAILRLDLGFALSTIEKVQTEIENLTGDGGRRCCAEFLVCTIDHTQNLPKTETPSQYNARNKQNQDNLKNYNLATIHTDLPPPASCSPPLQRRPSRRLELSQPAGPFQVRGEYPPRVSETRLLNLSKAVGRECQQQGDRSCWISEDLRR
jgi:hypothetical protein